MKTSTCLATCLMAALFMGSCRKSELPESESGYSRVRVYDDTLPDPRNQSIRIAAGDGRLFMTYGETFDQILFVNGSLTEPPPARCVWMLTDNDGNLIGRDTFPSGMHVGNVFALPDNGFLIVLFTGTPNLWGGPEWGLYMTRLDPNGVLGPVNTLDVPVLHPPPFQQVWDIRLYPSANGNVLIAFAYQGFDFAFSNFVGEMDAQGNFLWQKESETSGMSGCVSMPDGGYLVSAPIWDQVLQTSRIVIMKTTGTFDSVWSKDISSRVRNSAVQIASAGNGNYWLNYVYSPDGKAAFSYLLRIDAEGDVLDSTHYPVMNNYAPYNTRAVMVTRSESSVFISHGLDYVFNGVLDQFNSTYVTVDADMTVNGPSVFLNQSSDMINSACRMSNGKIACFGIMQSYGHRYYKPVLIVID